MCHHKKLSTTKYFVVVEVSALLIHFDSPLQCSIRIEMQELFILLLVK